MPCLILECSWRLAGHGEVFVIDHPDLTLHTDQISVKRIKQNFAKRADAVTVSEARIVPELVVSPLATVPRKDRVSIAVARPACVSGGDALILELQGGVLIDNKVLRVARPIGGRKLHIVVFGLDREDVCVNSQCRKPDIEVKFGHV